MSEPNHREWNWRSSTRRLLAIEKLESRELLSASQDFSTFFSDGYTESQQVIVGSIANRLDTDADGMVSARDVLLIVNEINNPTVSIDLKVSGTHNSAARLDVNADGLISPLDVLLVVNHLNSQPPSHLSPLANGSNVRAPESEAGATELQDILYVSDSGNDTVQTFDAATGTYRGAMFGNGAAGLLGPRGIAFDQGNLLLVNQNIGLAKNGEVLKYNLVTQQAVGGLVPASAVHSPVAPAGVVVRDNVVYVADTGEGSPTGRIATYDATTGAFLGAYRPRDFGPEFRPRGIVFGPDGGLFVTVSSIAKSDSVDPPGYIIRIDVESGHSRVIAWNDGDSRDDSQYGETPNLHNPIGIAFANDGKLYIASNKKDRLQNDENTRILNIDPLTGKELSSIQLQPQVANARLFAQAILVGPNNRLFIPAILHSLPTHTFSGWILAYDPTTKLTSPFYTPAVAGVDNFFPTYLAFGRTNSATLAYQNTQTPAAPTLARIEAFQLDFVANGPSQHVTQTVNIGDQDSGDLTKATLSITGNYRLGQDVLAYADSGALRGSWNAAAGTLTISGRARIAEYQAALRAVRFRSDAAIPDFSRRRIDITVFDGEQSSNLVSRTIHVVGDLSYRLYVGDQGDSEDPSDDSIYELEQRDGQLIRRVLPMSEIIGPRGMAFGSANLLVVNQNVGQAFNGEVLQYNAQDGVWRSALIANDDLNSPFAPRGIVVKDNVLYVADAEGPSRKGVNFHPIKKYNATTGQFLGDLVPNAGFVTDMLPRGLVFGPDGLLYATYFSAEHFNSSDPAGYILRFLDTTTGAYQVVAANYGSSFVGIDESPQMRNPEGMAFGLDGLLYVTSYIEDSFENGIVVVDVKKRSQVDFIPLGRNYAQAIIFGPNSELYVPITGGPDAGAVRAYNVLTKQFNTIVSSSNGSLQQPWYLVFARSNPATLTYEAFD